MKKLSILTAIGFFIGTSHCPAWDGYDYDDETFVEIGPGNLVREGQIIEFYDWNEGEYHKAKVNLVEDNFVYTTVEVHDLELKKDRILAMDKE